MGKDMEVVAVQMDGMRDVEGCFDGDVGPCIGLGYADDGVGFIKVGALFELQERRVVPVDDHGRTVEIPLGSVGHAPSHESRVLKDGRGDLINVPGHHRDEIYWGFVETVFRIGFGDCGGGGGVAAVMDDAFDIVGVLDFGAC